MIQSKYNYDAEIKAHAEMLAFSKKSKKKDIFAHIFVPLGLLIMLFILIYDIKHDENIIFDCVLIILLVILEIVNLSLPIIIKVSQRKSLKNLENGVVDFCITEYEKGKFKEKLYKDNKIVYQNEIHIDKLANFCEYKSFIILIFNNYQTMLFDSENFQSGSKEELLILLNKAMSYPKVKSKNSK